MSAHVKHPTATRPFAGGVAALKRLKAGSGEPAGMVVQPITRTPCAQAERRTCPVCQRSIFICPTKQGRAFREHDDQPVNGKLCDGSWRAVS